MIDPRPLRPRFPLLESRTYFATHSLGPLPRAAHADMDEYARSFQGGYRVFYRWFDKLNETIELVERLLEAPSGSVGLRDNATACQAAIAAAIEPRGERRRIVIAEHDFPSARYLWRAQARRGFEIVDVAAHEAPIVSGEEVARAIDERTAVVAVSLVSYRDGALLDLAPVVERARAHGALVVVDAFQAAGIVPLRVAELGADVVVGGMNKWLSGGVGMAYLYVRPELAASLAPAYPGWWGHDDPAAFAEEFVPAVGARRFQQGVPAIAPLYTVGAGLRFVLELGIDAIRERSVALTTRLFERFLEHRLPIRTPRDPARRGGTVCVVVPEPDEIVHALESLGIDVDARKGAGIRVSPHVANTESECDRVADAIADLVRVRLAV